MDIKLLYENHINAIKNQIDFVAPIYIPDVWWQVKDMLIDGLRHRPDAMKVSDIYHRLAVGQLVLVVVSQDTLLKGLALLAIEETVEGRVCLVYFLTGKNMTTWLTELHEQVLAWAKEQGCYKIKALGRVGWLKFYEQHGWEVSSYEFSLPVKRLLH